MPASFFVSLVLWLPSTPDGIFGFEVIEMKRVFMLIAVALVTMAMATSVFACGCGGKGGGKLKPQPIHGSLNRA